MAFRKIFAVLTFIFSSHLFAAESNTQKLQSILDELLDLRGTEKEAYYKSQKNYIKELLTDSQDPADPNIENQCDNKIYCHDIMHYVCWFGDEDMLDLLLSLGADFISDRGDEFLVPLYVATQQGHLEIVRKLIEAYKKAKLLENRIHRHIQLALNDAAMFGHKDIIQFLIEDAGANPLMSTHEGGTIPLVQAVRYGRLEAVQELMQYPHSESQVGDALVTASQSPGYIDIANLLIGEFHADVNYQDPSTRETSLMVIAGSGGTNGDDEIHYLDMLVRKHKANFMIKSVGDQHALVYAASSGALPLVILLLAYEVYSEYEIHGAIEYEQSQQTLNLLKTYFETSGLLARRTVLLDSIVAPHGQVFQPDGQGANVQRDMLGLACLVLDIFGYQKSGESIVHAAVRSGHAGILYLLLQNDGLAISLINEPNANGQTPISLALEMNNQLAANILLSYGVPLPSENEGAVQASVRKISRQKFRRAFLEAFSNILPQLAPYMQTTDSEHTPFSVYAHIGAFMALLNLQSRT